MANQQGIILEPTGCANGDQIPLNSDKCFNNLVENRSPQVYKQLDPQTGLLPRVGGDLQILIPIVLAVLFTFLYIIAKKVRD